MNIASLALASALAAIVGSAQPAAAQTQDQTGAATIDRAAPEDNATPGSANADRRDDEDRDPALSGRRDDEGAARRWNERGPTMMRMRPVMPQRQMMLRGTGAHFHFARGKARVDVVCSPQEDSEACVRAAGELIDKIAELRGGGGDRDSMSGSAGRDDERSGTQSEERDDSGAPGERM